MGKACTEAEYDRKALNAIEKAFGRGSVAEKAEIHYKSPLLKLGLKKASKSGKGPGYPDGMVFLTDGTPYLMLESKSPNKLREAISDLKHYISKTSQSGIYIPFAIAVSGDNSIIIKIEKLTNRFLPIFISEMDGQGVVHQTKLRVEKLELLDKYTEILQYLYQQNTNIYTKSGGPINHNDLVDFCVTLNNRFQARNVQQANRPFVFTYFLMACLDSIFVQNANLPCSALFPIAQAAIKNVIVSKSLLLSKPIMCTSSEFDVILETIDLYIAKHNKQKTTKIISRHAFVTNLIGSANIIGDAYEVFYTYGGTNDMGQYFTPRHAVHFMIDLLEKTRNQKLDDTDTIYDPACGVGGFLCIGFQHAVANTLKANPNLIMGVIAGQMGKQIYGCEAVDDIADIAKVNMLLRGDGRSGIVSQSSLDKDFPNSISNIRNRLGYVTNGSDFDDAHAIKPTVVLMNPPYPTKTSNFTSYDFVNHALDIVMDGAYVCALVPVSVLNGKVPHFIEFRKNVLSRARLDSVIVLPPDLFEPKAAVNTAVVILQKCAFGQDLSKEIVFAACTSDGLEMHKGAKQRVPNTKIANEFNLLLNHWWQNDDISEKFLRLRAGKIKNLTSGAEWSPYAYLKSSPMRTADDEIVRLAKYIKMESNYGKNIDRLGERW